MIYQLHEARLEGLQATRIVNEGFVPLGFTGGDIPRRRVRGRPEPLSARTTPPGSVPASQIPCIPILQVHRLIKERTE